jgi:uncharacterized phage protein gp47/JayE
MPFQRDTLRIISTRIKNDIKSRVKGSTTFLRRSVLIDMSKSYAGEIHLQYGKLADDANQLFITTADTTFLEQLGAEYGVFRKKAENATGSGVVTGTNGKLISAGTELQSGANKVYLVDSDVTISGGTAIVDFTAEEAGADSNDDPAIELTFVSPIPGVSTIVTVDSVGITGGINEETDDSYRARILTRKRQAPHGGAAFDYVNWALEVPGVTRAWSFPEYLGYGTIALGFVKDVTDPITGIVTTNFPNESEIEEVRSYIESHIDPVTGGTIGRPITTKYGLIMLELGPKTVDIIVNISPDTQAVRDSITQNSQDLFLIEGSPQDTIYISQIRGAISAAIDEDWHELIYPTQDITTTATELHILGDITFGAL